MDQFPTSRMREDWNTDETIWPRDSSDLQILNWKPLKQFQIWTGWNKAVWSFSRPCIQRAQVYYFICKTLIYSLTVFYIVNSVNSKIGVGYGCSKASNKCRNKYLQLITRKVMSNEHLNEGDFGYKYILQQLQSSELTSRCRLPHAGWGVHTPQVVYLSTS